MLRISCDLQPNHGVQLTAYSLRSAALCFGFRQQVSLGVRLGAKSRNAYARYERGTSVPTLDKLTELLQAVAPGHDFVLQQSMMK
jgi:hypothetical protein